MEIYSDKAIQVIEDDLLSRREFSEQLAKAISSYSSSSDKLAIGLYGKWGSGKTSVLNMVKKNISERNNKVSEDEEIIVIDFNPWNYSDSTELIVQFFQEILSALLEFPDNGHLKIVASELKNYAKFFKSAEKLPGIGSFFNFIGGITEFFGKKAEEEYKKSNTLSEKKKRVIKALEDQKQKLLIIIDDIDRLNNKQIRSIFQLINSVADFPNMIYLLSFDRDVVARALHKEQNCDGNEYLEKMIQIPFEIPETKQSAINYFIEEKLCEILSERQEIDLEEENINFKIDDYISPFVRNMREAKRLLNAFAFKYDLLYQETHYMDLLLITVLQIYAPDVIKWVYNNKPLFSQNREHLAGIEKEGQKDYLRILSSMCSKPKEVCVVLQKLFPRFSMRTDRHNNESLDSLRKNKKIACPERFDFYFTLSLVDLAANSKEVMDSVYSYNKNMLDNFWDKLREKNKVYEYAIELHSRIEDLPEYRYELFLNALIRMQTLDIRDCFEKNRFRCDNGRPFSRSTADWCLECCFSIFSFMVCEKIEIYLTKKIETAELNELAVLCKIIQYIEMAYKQHDIETEREKTDRYMIIEEQQLKNIENIAKKRLELLLEKENLFDSPGFIIIHNMWKKNDKKAATEYFEEALEDDSNLQKFKNIIYADHRVYSEYVDTMLD